MAIKNTDSDIMNRILAKKKLSFTSVLKAKPHVFIRRGHPAMGKDVLTYGDLKEYPFVSYEQGNHNISFFTEEITEDTNIDKHIEISDRASLMNVLLTTDSYTVGTGIMPSTLNDGKIMSIPLVADSYYDIGYILHDDRKGTDLMRSFINMLDGLREKVMDL